MTVKDALLTVCDNVGHYREHKATPPYIVWMEDGQNVHRSDNRISERSWTGRVDLYTMTEYDPLFRAVPDAVEDAGHSIRLDSVQYEDGSGLIHYSWDYWEVS